VTLGAGIDPYGITQDLLGNFYVAVKYWNGFIVFDGNLNQLTQPCSNGSMLGAYGIAVDETGAVYVGANVSMVMTKIQACFPNAPPVYHGLNPPSAGQCFVYPSPAKGDHATVSYDMVESGQAELKVWNERAELVYHATETKPAGVQISSFSLAGYASGVYLYNLALRYVSGRVENIPLHKFAVIH